MSVMVLARFAGRVATGARGDGEGEIDMDELIEVIYTWQFCQGDSDISTSFNAELDADMVRAWEEDFCLVEVTKVDDHWEVTGGDGNWTPIADRRFAHYGDALDAYAALNGLNVHEQA